MFSALALSLHQVAEDADEIAAHRAADAAIVHLEHFPLGIENESGTVCECISARKRRQRVAGFCAILGN